MGSDHEVFEAAGFRVPMVYFHDYPDVTIHTQKDLPENLDATKLGRVAYIGAGTVWTLAALPDAEAPRLLAVARASVEQQVLARGAAAGPDPALAAREAMASGIEHARVARAAVPGDRPGRREGRRAPARRHASRAARLRPPAAAKNPDILGPLNVYYYDYFADIPGADLTGIALAARPDGEVLAYEAINLADGTRSVSEIRDVLSARYSPVEAAAVAEYFDRLAKAGVVSFR